MVADMSAARIASILTIDSGSAIEPVVDLKIERSGERKALGALHCSLRQFRCGLLNESQYSLQGLGTARKTMTPSRQTLQRGWRVRIDDKCKETEALSFDA